MKGANQKSVTEKEQPQVVLVRVGIDSGSGGMQGPLFEDGTFEFVPIPNKRFRPDERTYGNSKGRSGRAFSEYFRASRRAVMAETTMHVDPEWETFTYGDPTSPKAVLRRLKPSDLLVFYCGLQRWNEATGWDTSESPALYLAGYFHVTLAGLATEFEEAVLQSEFAENFHVRHPQVFEEQKQELVLVKGDVKKSRFFRHAHCISALGQDKNGAPLKVLSPEAQEVFGGFDGRIGIQMSTPRWVRPEFIQTAMKYLHSLD